MSQSASRFRKTSQTTTNYSTALIDPLPNIDGEDGSILLADEYILPFQINYLRSSEYQTGVAFVGCKGLWAATFLAGVSDALLPTTHKNKEVERKYRRLKQAAIEWIGTTGEVKSFGWCCSVLGIDEQSARAKILQDIAQNPEGSRLLME